MTFELPNLMPMLPEMALLAMTCFILIFDLFIQDENRSVTFVLAQIAVFVTAGCIVGTSGPSVSLFGDMFTRDAMADVLKLMICLSVEIMFIYSSTYLKLRGLFKGEYFVLTLFAMMGMMILVSAGHFLTLYLGLELMALSFYAMIALDRDNARATEAAMKYFVLGALASGLLLYGMSMLYGVTGSLDIARVALAIDSGQVAIGAPLVFGLVFVVAGLAFKIGAVPFHMWIPDVYEGAPTPIALFIGTAPKFAAFAFFMRLLIGGLHGLVGDWQQMLVVMSVLSIVVGNVTAIAQTNFKRMLAYSTISHMGFVLLGILSGNVAGYSSAMYYMAVYVIMSLGAFGMVLLLSRAGFESDMLDDFKGLNQRSPWYAFMLLLVMFAMAGVPPTVGFYAKFAVLQAALQAGYVWLAVLAVLFSVVGAFYYLRIVKLMYFDEPQQLAPIAPRMDVRLIMSLNGLAMLVLGLMPQSLMSLCTYSIMHSF
ncbi:MAG: NADH-quinone oxidoreductase subunit NuoN [Pseudomonadota bacterium]|nr:NADH-quinone oxidoreductase subunit NuoN [Pseudomonadota bacterium]